jgi:hypothetical protein
MTEQEINASEHIEAENAKAAQEEMQARELEEQVRLQDDELMHHSRTPRGRRVLHDFFTPRTVQIENPQEDSSLPRELPQNGEGRGRQLRRSPTRLHRMGIRESRKYFLISVRRQRKLKMKKHKYKKLMRKTRNLRRRQDKL